MLDLQSIIQEALLKFKGMELDSRTLEYMTIEVNDIMKRLHPKFKESYYVEPYFVKETDITKIKFNLHRIQ